MRSIPCGDLNRGFDVYDDDLGLEPGRANDLFLVERRGDRTVDRLLAWLDKQGSAPFFVWLHLYDPHSPYRPPEPYLSKYASHPYDGEIAFDDAQVGRVFARLQEMHRFDAMAIAAAQRPRRVTGRARRGRAWVLYLQRHAARAA